MLGNKTRIGAGVALAFAGALAFSACASGSGSTTASSSASTTPMASASASSSASASMDPMADLVGSGCAAYAAAVPSGTGSVEGMSQDPVATAASNNPLLTTLTAPVTGAYNPGVNLVDTLNSSTAEYTVFAPVDDAFAKIDSATLEALKTDSATLTKILTYHVLPERLNPDQIDGTHATVEGGTLEVTGSGNNIVVNGTSAVICGGVQTANATVYLIDTVLMPPM